MEAWSSPDALAKCGITHKNIRSGCTSPETDDYCRTEAPSPNEHSVLWNAMIFPFLNMTIKGAVWYQGEANAGMCSCIHKLLGVCMYVFASQELHILTTVHSLQ